MRFCTWILGACVYQGHFRRSPGNLEGIDSIEWLYRRLVGKRRHCKSRGVYFFFSYGKGKENQMETGFFVYHRMGVYYLLLMGCHM